MEQVLWALDLKLTHSDSLAQMKLMKYVTNGTFDAERSIFQVPVVIKKPEPTLSMSRRRKTIDQEEVSRVFTFHLLPFTFLSFLCVTFHNMRAIISFVVLSELFSNSHVLSVFLKNRRHFFPAPAKSISLCDIQFQAPTQQLKCDSLQRLLSNVSSSRHRV